MIKLLSLLLVFGIVSCKLKIDFEKEQIHLITGQDELEKFLGHDKGIKMVYFYIKEVKHIRIFFHELKKSAEFLEMYGVKIGFVNCTDDASRKVSDCSKPNIENSVHTYRGGTPLLPLEMETMFDVNSIMSNTLQLVMLREVPILQTPKEVEKYLGNLRGQKDVVFGHMKAIGTVEHRVFMEVAYAYMDKLQFIVCTDKKATKMFEQPPKRMGKDVSSVWWVWTKQAGDSVTRYPNVRYRGGFNLKSLATFVSTVLKPRLYDIPAHGMDHPFSGYEVPIVHFYYDMKSREEAYQKADMLSRTYGGTVGTLLVNMEDEEVKKTYQFSGEMPTMSFKLTAEAPEHFLPYGLESDNMLRFMEENLGALLGVPASEKQKDDFPKVDEHSHLPPDEMEIMMEDRPHEPEPTDYERPPLDNFESVEKEDDRLAEVVERTRNKGWQLDRIPALRDSTFREALKLTPTVIIMLYHPFDAVCMANLRMFGEAAELLGEQTALTLRRVNCYDWTDVCQAENITIYPTLRVYKSGEKAWDYSGPQDTRAMFSTFKLLELGAPVYEAIAKDVNKYLNGKDDESLTGITRTVVTGIFSKETKKEIEVFRQVAEQLQVKERILFVFSDGMETSQIARQVGCAVPCLVLSRYDDSAQPHTTITGSFTVDNLRQFISDNKLPKLAVLTPLLLPSVREKFSELVILFTDQSDRCQNSEDVLRGIVKAQKFNNVSFNMMPVPDEKSVGYKVLEKYTVKPTVPHLSLVNFQKGEVFNFDQEDFETDSVSQWLSEVVEGVAQPSAKLEQGEWKPLNRGYEYLKIIDWEREQARKKGLKDKRSRAEPMEEIPTDTPVPENSGRMSEEQAQRLAVDEPDDADTRKELFELRNSRLYHHHHHSPGKTGHHGEQNGKPGNHDNKERTMPTDEGYQSDNGGRESPEKFSNQNQDKMTKDGKSKHDHSEL